MDKVSIILPVYNSEKYIKRCIDSILDQTYTNFELLVINDGSKDNSLKEIKKYKDKRIRIIDKKNEGVAKTRNLGIKESTGKYIMFIDNDDFIDNDYISSFINNIEDNDILIGSYKRVDDEKLLFKYNLVSDSSWSKYVVLAPWAKLYKRDFLVNNKIEFLDYKIGEDVYFNLLCYSKTDKIKVFNNQSYNWYYNNKSVSNTTQKGLNQNVDISILLHKILSFINIKDNNNTYFIERYIYWYLLFSGRYANKKVFKKQYNSYIEFLNKNNIKTNINPLVLKGEPFKIKMIVFIFRIIRKFRLIGIFSSIYCKGGN